MAEDKKKEFRKTLLEVKSLSTLPAVVAKLTRMAEDPETTSEQMGKVLAKDHIMAAKLLKLVNSSFYGFPQKISSLTSAIILLGFNVIKSLIISSSIFELMEEQDIELWEHSLACAVACNVLAKHLGVSDPEEISTAGLIHDIGKVSIKMGLPEAYAEIGRFSEKKGVSRYKAEQAVLGLNHAEAGGWLAKNWNLPAKLREPVTFHHTPAQVKDEKMATTIVHFSNIIVRGMGYGHGPDIWVPPLDKQAWDMLSLSARDLDEIIEAVEERLWEVKGFSMEIDGAA
ncbi:MAG: HDOD domain-containing protein [Thermodesulfobacteriota bacterium]